MWVEAGNPEWTFWRQTPRTFQAVMEGCARREERHAALAMATGWHVENFRRAGKNLRNLGHYLKQFSSTPADPADEAAQAFQGLAERGLVTIREVSKES